MLNVIRFDNCIYDSVQLAEQFMKLGERFIRYYENNKHALNFRVIDIEETECGTIACHGGFGLCILSAIKKQNPTKKKCNFLDGIVVISNYLGFEGETTDTTYLEDWAKENPHLWGNEYGCFMFSTRGHKAFGFSDENKYQVTLLDIGKHYLKVSQNLLDITFGVKAHG